MKMGWNYHKYAKVMLSLVACFGIILLCISIWTLADPVLKYFHFTKLYRYDRLYFEGRMLIIAPAIGIALGIAIVTVTTVGIILSMDNASTRRVVTWGSGLLLILNIAGIASLCVADDIMNRYKVLEVLYEKIKDYHYTKEAMDFMDAVQWQLQCCGIYGPYDYPAPTGTVFGVPDTCPEPPMPQRGCIDLMLTYVIRRWEILISIYIILTLFQVAAASSVCLLGYKGFSRTPTDEQ